MNSQLGGELGTLMQHVDENRDDDAHLEHVGDKHRRAAQELYGALIATCQGKALVVVQRTQSGEGLEAWRQLLKKYEPLSKQTKVMKLLEVLTFDFFDLAKGFGF